MPSVRIRVASLSRAASLAAISLTLGSTASAQYQFDSWAIEDGLPQNSVNDILQTRDGYLWLATYGGLVRFDGVRFVVFDRSMDGVGSLRIRTLHEDRSGTLWAATDDGMLLRYRSGAVTTFDAEDGVPRAAALRINEDERGALWITWAGLVTKFDGRTFETYKPGDFPSNVRPHEQDPRSFSPHSTWWSRDSQGLHCLVAGVVTNCLPPPDLPAHEIVDVATEANGSIWVRFADESLVRITGTARRTYRPAELPRGNADRLLFTDRDGRLWSSGPNAVRRIAGGRAEVVAALGALVMYQDREGSIWIGATDGLRRLRTPSIAVRSTNDGLSSNNVYALLRDTTGAVWVGTWGAGVNRYSAGRFRSYRRTDGLPSDDITAIYEDSGGRLWVGTTLGLSYKDGDRFVRFSGASGWLARHVWTILQDKSGDLWFGTNDGLVRQHTDGFTRYGANDGLSHDRITVLFEDRARTLWIGTSQGLTRYRDGRFSTFTERDGFIGNDVRVIHEDADGAIWIGTYDAGLYRLKDDRLSRLTTTQGLHDNGVFQILEDGTGNFWMGSNRGIFRVSRQQLTDVSEGRAARVQSAVYGLRDGLTTLECNGGRQPSGLRMEDGTLWIPTQGGIAIVDPAAVGPKLDPPPVQVEEVRLQGKPMPFDGGVEVPADGHVLEVRYTALAFAKPDLVRFRHRLVGLDGDWVDAGPSRVVTYYRLPPGRYEFQVTAANSDGVWNPGGDRLALVVLAPVWRQWWFLALVGLVVAAGAVLVERRRTARLRRDHAQQQAFARQLLETQESERRRISNELHDSLGQSLFMIRQRTRSGLERDRVEDGRGGTLDQIAGLAAKAYDELKEIAYGLRPYQLDKVGLSRTIEGLLRRVASACAIEIDSDIEDVDALLPPGAQINVYRIVQEGMNNIVKHSGATRARVRLRRIGRGIELEISDDGCGFQIGSDAADASRRTFGLTSIEERARVSNGDVTIRSKPGQGTTVLVRFQIHEPGHPS